MKKITHTMTKVRTLFFAVFIVASILSCGVESLPVERRLEIRGTLQGDISRRYSVTDILSGETAVTDQNGAFTIVVATSDGSAQLLVTHSDTSLEVSLPDTPADGTIDVAIELLETAGGIELMSVEVVDLSEEEDGSNAPQQDTENSPPEMTDGSSEPPVATPVPSGPFDESGNTTSFGIPRGISGNISRGRRKWNEKCGECHGENGVGLGFSRLRRVIAGPPMFLEETDRDLADIVAYLNRRER